MLRVEGDVVNGIDVLVAIGHAVRAVAFEREVVLGADALGYQTCGKQNLPNSFEDYRHGKHASKMLNHRNLADFTFQASNGRTKDRVQHLFLGILGVHVLDGHATLHASQSKTWE